MQNVGSEIRSAVALLFLAVTTMFLSSAIGDIKDILAEHRKRIEILEARCK